MKWLFSLLVLANIALLIWGVQRERSVSEVSMEESVSVGEMRLLSESGSTKVQPPVEGISSETAEAPGDEDLQSTSQEPEPVPVEQVGIEMSAEIVVDPAQVAGQPETEVDEAIRESGLTGQIAGAASANGAIEATIAAGTQESLEDTVADQSPIASTESQPAGESETPPEDTASGVAQEDQSADSPENVAEVEEGILEPVTTEDIPVEEAQYCGTVGPLEEEKDANGLLEALTKREMDAVLRKETVRKAAGFWVIIPPYATNLEAREEERRLASEGVKDYRRFYRGEFKNGISLGIYSRSRNAEIRRAAIESKGFSPELVPRTKRVTEFWLDYKAAPVDKTANQDWLAENYPQLGTQDQSCSPIATP